MTVARRIVTRTSGHRHGPITRLMSPGDIGQITKPFVFLDDIDAPAGAGPNFGFHPHSGIATLTFPLDFDVQHQTSSGQTDIVHARGVEWVVAGGGVWHKAQPLGGSARLHGFQLWLALPPKHELDASHAVFIEAEAIPKVGAVTVLLGEYQGQTSPVPAPLQATYLWIELQDGEIWTYQPPAGQNVAWVFAQSGELMVGTDVLKRELAVFEEGSGTLTFQAKGACGFLLGAAVKSEHDLVLGPYSVHTSAQALATGVKNIEILGRSLHGMS